MDLIVNLSLAFLEGLGIIISPCILPVLPIIFATSLTGGKYRPYGIMIGFIIAFCVFTLCARALVIATGINLDFIRNLSFLLLILLAIIMMSTYLSNVFSKLTQKLSQYGASISAKQNQEGGFLNGILIGLPIGLIWTPCAGPIIAAVILQTVRAKTTIETLLTLFIFSIGVAIPILCIIVFGKKILDRQTVLTRHAESIRKILGGALFFSVILSMQGILYIPSMEIKASEKQLKSNALLNALVSPYPAPEILGINEWINSPPLTINSLKGKVILIDFWTYSCINCVRTLPYLKDWYAKYHDKGLVIIGIHSPEFAFEQKLENVKRAVKQLGISYPVALDNLFMTWDNYKNHYWPAHYLINKQGMVVYTHFGEGEYDLTEHNIQVLLGHKTSFSNAQHPQQKRPLFFTAITPETYLGSQRASGFAGQQLISSNFVYPNLLPRNLWALEGKWEVMPQQIITGAKGAAIKLHFQGQKVFLVLGTKDQKIKTASLLLNGKPVGKAGGKAVKNSQLVIKADALYELIDLPESSEGILEIIFDQPGAEAYAFTFG